MKRLLSVVSFSSEKLALALSRKGLELAPGNGLIFPSTQSSGEYPAYLDIAFLALQGGSSTAQSLRAFGSDDQHDILLSCVSALHHFAQHGQVAHVLQWVLHY